MIRKKFAWEPYGPYLDSRVARFMKKHGIQTWQDLIRRSTEDIEWFWPVALQDLGVEWYKPYRTLYDNSKGMPWTRWFLGGKINIVHNCLDRHVKKDKGDKVAVYFEMDDGNSRKITYRELYDVVNRLAASMKAQGIRKGDVVAMCMPISIEAVVVMLAALKIGAVSLQIAPRVGVDEIVDSINRGHAKILFMNASYPREGKWFDCSHIHNAALERIPTCEKIVLVNRGTSNVALTHKSMWWDDFMDFGSGLRTPKTEKLDSEHPSLILFSSGTTGRSKAVVHTHAGALASITREIGYAFDCRENDVFYWFTTIGWMMAPWEIIGSLFFGASLVLYEGTHRYPTPHRMFELIEKYGITIFGFTPTAMRGLAKLNEDFSRHNLSSLRILGSTGEPLDPETWLWYFRIFGQGRCPIMNIIGGTEMIGCLLSPFPVMPQKPGTVGGPGLGMDVAVYDDEGKEVEVGEGHLVCRKPFPSMTRGFLGERQRYLDTYFSRWQNVWTHGDRVAKDEDGLWYVLGRDDDVIVVGGVKFDPSKIESALIEYKGQPRVVEAAAVGASDPLKGQRIVCFATIEGQAPADPAELDEFIDALQREVQTRYDPMARPEEIYIIEILPKNQASKIPRKLIRMAYEGEDLGDVSKVDNLQAFDAIREIGAKQRKGKKF